MNEIWLPVKGYEGIYEISDTGKLRSLVTRKGHCPRIIKGDRPKGYVRYRLHKDGNSKRIQAHQLVMLAFVGPVPNRCEINHKNGIHDDNRLQNLEYVTRSENQSHKFHVLGYKRPPLTKTRFKRLSKAEVSQIRQQRNSGSLLRELAERFGVSVGAISLAVRNRTWRSAA